MKKKIVTVTLCIVLVGATAVGCAGRHAAGTGDSTADTGESATYEEYRAYRNSIEQYDLQDETYSEQDCVDSDGNIKYARPVSEIVDTDKADYDKYKAIANLYIPDKLVQSALTSRLVELAVELAQNASIHAIEPISREEDLKSYMGWSNVIEESLRRTDCYKEYAAYYVKNVPDLTLSYNDWNIQNSIDMMEIIIGGPEGYDALTSEEREAFVTAAVNAAMKRETSGYYKDSYTYENQYTISPFIRAAKAYGQTENPWKKYLEDFNFNDEQKAFVDKAVKIIDEGPGVYFQTWYEATSMPELADK